MLVLKEKLSYTLITILSPILLQIPTKKKKKKKTFPDMMIIGLQFGFWIQIQIQAQPDPFSKHAR